MDHRTVFQIEIAGAKRIDDSQSSGLALVAEKFDQFCEGKVVKFSCECHVISSRRVSREGRGGSGHAEIVNNLAGYFDGLAG